MVGLNLQRGGRAVHSDFKKVPFVRDGQEVSR